MNPSFLQQYLEAFHDIEGWFSFDAALLFMAYRKLAGVQEIPGDVLEIGVHHGLSSIAIAAMRGEGGRFVAVDLFEELQSENVSRSGEGNRAIFLRNLARFFSSTAFIEMITSRSSDLTVERLGRGFSFCHIDGGHLAEETYRDLDLCCAVTVPGGLIAIDDYFNPLYPGVSEGTAEFLVKNKGALRPLAIGYNKVLFQRTPGDPGLAAKFLEKFPAIAEATPLFFGAPAPVLCKPLRDYVDLFASTPRHVLRKGESRLAQLQPEKNSLECKKGKKITLNVSLRNQSAEVFPHGSRQLGLSYHLLESDGSVLRHDNDRTYLQEPLAPGAGLVLPLEIQVPREPGSYWLELDLVWEGVMWFKDTGNPTPRVQLVVR